MMRVSGSESESEREEEMKSEIWGEGYKYAAWTTKWVKKTSQMQRRG